MRTSLSLPCLSGAPRSCVLTTSSWNRARLAHRPHGGDHNCRPILSAPLRATGDDDDAPSLPLGDWREFRARLVSQQSVGEAGAPTSSRQSEDNVRLLELQNESLAREGQWAHSTPRLEAGGLLVAAPDAHELLKDESLWQAVIFLIEHGPEGSLGLLLNRPTGLMLGRQKGGLPFEISNAPGLQETFSSSRVYCGGRTAQSVVHIMHGKALPSAVEVVPGIFLGGPEAAALEVGAGRMERQDFKFFAGACIWDAGQLEQELRAGAWYTAAASRSLVLKPCLQLPVPLWREVLLLMGGDFKEAAAQGYEGDE